MEEKEPTYNDEISLRDLVLKIKSFIREIFRYWKIPALCILIAVAFQTYKYLQFVPEYPAKITFSVDEDEGGSNSGLTGILGQFGLTSVRPSRYNLDKILALSKSRRVIEHTLFHKTTIDGKEDYLANHLIRIYQLNNSKENKKSGTPDFYFTRDSLDAFDRTENAKLLSLYNFIIGPPEDPKLALITADYNEDTNIMSLDASTTHEDLSLALADRMFVSLSNYYINKAIEKQFKTYTVVSAKKDSVLAVLKSNEYQLANFKDTHRSMLMRTDQITELRLQREIAALSAMYAEVLKNTEIADFSLKNKLPFIQVIDEPLSPIAPTQISLLRMLIIGMMIGGAIGPSQVAAAVFTTNRVVGAPVVWSRQAVADGVVSAVVLNSGGANVCTGPDGLPRRAPRRPRRSAPVLEISPGDVVVCSTGLIGEPLPIDKLLAGVDTAVAALSPRRRARRRRRDHDHRHRPEDRAPARSTATAASGPSAAWPRVRGCSRPAWRRCSA